MDDEIRSPAVFATFRNFVLFDLFIIDFKIKVLLHLLANQ